MKYKENCFTQWHRGSVKPVHNGVYEKDGEYSYWTGKIWNCMSETIEGAYQNHLKNPVYQSFWSYDRWRGLRVKE